MRQHMDQSRFMSEWPGWLLRGCCCAAPSAFWALAMDFRQPTEIVAMLVGVGCYVSAFAGFYAWKPMSTTAGRIRFLRALKTAVWTKTAMVVLGIGAWEWARVAKAHANGWPMVGIVLDFGLGMLAMIFVGRVGGFHDPAQIGRLNSFAWTWLTTVVQGALITALLLLLALAVTGWCWGADRLKHRSRLTTTQA